MAKKIKFSLFFLHKLLTHLKFSLYKDLEINRIRREL